MVVAGRLVEDVGVDAFVVEGIGVAALVPQPALAAKVSSAAAAPANRALLLAMTSHFCAMEQVSEIAAIQISQLFDSLTRPHRRHRAPSNLDRRRPWLPHSGSAVSSGGGSKQNRKCEPVISGGGTQGLHRGVTGPVDAFRRYPWCAYSSTSKSAPQYRGYRKHADDPRTCPHRSGAVRVNSTDISPEQRWSRNWKIGRQQRIRQPKMCCGGSLLN